MLTLILGGARSGKSRYAQSLCDSSAHIVYIATARSDETVDGAVDGAAGDQEMRERIARHRADRPASWQTIEEPLDLARAVREAPVEAILLIDCVTLWISNLMWDHNGSTAAELEQLIIAQVDELIINLRKRTEISADAGEVVMVSNEVGGGLVPEHRVGRVFRDLQGFANQRLAQAADIVILVVAGLPLHIKV